MPKTKPTSRRGRPRRAESFAEWMARVDTQVETAYRKVCAAPPAARLLNAHQRRIVEMLVEHMRSLPQLQPGEDPYKLPAYSRIRAVLTNLFRAKHPDWKPDNMGFYWVDGIPAGDCAVFERLFRNCAGRAPEEYETADEGED